MEEKKLSNILSVLIFLFIINSIIFSIIVFKLPNNNSQHNVCYHFCDTECGRTIFCASHITQKQCINSNGLWLLETPERDRLQRHNLLAHWYFEQKITHTEINKWH